ncbi:MAG: hypothetical protein RR573_03405 [Oscillospiraceae bacterium]
MIKSIFAPIIDALTPLYNAISKMLQNPPKIINEIAVTIIRFFVLGLIMLFVLLMLELIKNILLHKGKYALTQGICCALLCVCFYMIFTPRRLPLPPMDMRTGDGYIVSQDKNTKLTTIEYARLDTVLRDYKGSLILGKKLPHTFTDDSSAIKLVLTYVNKSVTVNINKSCAYYDKGTDASLMYKFKDDDGELYETLTKLANKEN